MQPAIVLPTSDGGLSPARHIAEASWLLLALLLCLALDAFHLGSASLWGDEVFSRYYYDLFGLHFMFTEGLQAEPTPPTYSILLEGWMYLFGHSEAAMRSLSTVCDAAAVPVVFLLARELSGRREAMLAALLFAVCPTGLNFAQEARVYAMTLPATAAVLLTVALYLRDPRSRTASVSYVLCATLCLYLHATLVFMVASCAAVVTVALLARGMVTNRSAVSRWVALNVIVLLLGLPYLMHLVSASHTGGLDWIGPLRLHDVVHSVAAMIDGLQTPFPWPSALIATVFLLALAASLLLHRPTAREASVLMFIPGAFLALLILVSVFRPILLPRVLVWIIVPLCILASQQILRAGRLRLVVMASTALAFGTGLVTQETAPNANKEPWRAVFAQLGQELGRADLVVLSPDFNPMVLSYYAPALRSLRMWDEQLRPSIMTMAASRMRIPTLNREQIIDNIAAGKDVWVLSNSVDLPYLKLLNGSRPAKQVVKWNCGNSPCVEVERLGATNSVNALVPPLSVGDNPPG